MIKESDHQTTNSVPLPPTPEMAGYPLYRTDLCDSREAVGTITHLRAAWRHIPSEEEQMRAAHNPGADGFCETVSNFIKKIDSPLDSQGAPITSTSEGDKNPSDPPDLEPDTPWRRGVYYMFNHVFWDATKSLEKFGADSGHFHPPDEDFMTIRYGEEKKIAWATNTLIGPIFRARNVVVKGRLANPETVLKPEETDQDLAFHQGNAFELWCLRAGQSLVLKAVETGQETRPVGDVAAVLVTGKLCTGQRAI